MHKTYHCDMKNLQFSGEGYNLIPRTHPSGEGAHSLLHPTPRFIVLYAICAMGTTNYFGPRDSQSFNPALRAWRRIKTTKNYCKKR